MFQITVLDWPSKSPDLNIIENVWAIMARELDEEGNLQGLTADNLWRKVEKKWEELRQRPGLFMNLAESMPRRLQTVVDAAAIKY